MKDRADRARYDRARDGLMRHEHDVAEEARRSIVPVDLPTVSTVLQPAPTREARGRLPSLDGVRALSIALVILGHAGGQLRPEDRYLKVFLTDRGGAHLGVSIFFMLSGYLITRLLLNEATAQGHISLGAFYLRRAYRILPAFYGYVAFLLIANAVEIVSIPSRDFLAAATFTRNYHSGDGRWLGHAWSLSVEEQFYIMWPTALVLAGPRHARAIALFVIGLEPFVRVGWYFAFPVDRAFIPIMGHTRMDVLLAGCVLALVEHSSSGKEWLSRQVTSRRAQGISRGARERGVERAIPRRLLSARRVFDRGSNHRLPSVLGHASHRGECGSGPDLSPGEVARPSLVQPLYLAAVLLLDRSLCLPVQCSGGRRRSVGLVLLSRKALAEGPRPSALACVTPISARR